MVKLRAPLNELEYKIRDVLVHKLGDYIMLGVEQAWGISSRDKAANRAHKEIVETTEALMKVLRFKQGEDDAADQKGRQDQGGHEEAVRQGQG